jgi:hypothetical protein
MKNRVLKITTSLFVLAALGLISCSKAQQTQEEIVAQNAKIYVQDKISSSESYELVNLELIDSVLVIDNIKFRKIFLRKQTEENLKKLYQIRESQTENLSEEEKDKIKKLKLQVENKERMLHKIDSIEVALGDKVRETASYTYRFDYKANNEFGKQELNETYLQAGSAPEYKVLIITTDKKELRLHSNDFPGYTEMIDKSIK